MGNILSVYTAAQRSVMLEELSASIREHGFAIVLDVTKLLIQLRNGICLPPAVAATFADLSSRVEDFNVLFAVLKSKSPTLDELACTSNLRHEFLPFPFSRPRIEDPSVDLFLRNGVQGETNVGSTQCRIGVKRDRCIAFDDSEDSDGLEEEHPMKRVAVREMRSEMRSGLGIMVRDYGFAFDELPIGREDDATKTMALEAVHGDNVICECLPQGITPIARKGIVDLSWDMMGAVLRFLPREEWRGLALTNKRFRSDITAMVLREERVASFSYSDPQTWELNFSTLTSFAVLNRHWRLGPLFQPIKRITFSLPYDVGERTYCSETILQFFLSLSQDTQHVKDIYLNLGIIWDMSEAGEVPNIDYDLLNQVLQEAHRSGCRRLNISSVDILGPAKRESLAHILTGMHEEQMHLNSLSLETVAFSSPTLTPWFMRQVSGNHCLSYLKFSGTGFTPAQLDVVLCYFDLPQLESLVIGDAWLASVVELLQRCPRLNSVHLLELSADFRLADGTYASLPELRCLRGNATALSHLIPSLIDVPWESLWEIEIDTNKLEDPDDSIVHTLDTESYAKVVRLLLLNNAKLEILAFAFPSLAAFTTPIFQMEEMHDETRLCEVNRFRIKLHCNTEQENGELMDAMVPWISSFQFLKSVLLYSVGPRINVLDKFAFRSVLYSFRPDLLVKVD